MYEELKNYNGLNKLVSGIVWSRCLSLNFQSD